MAPLYEKNLDLYRLREKCASIRAVNIPPDVESLFTGKEDEMFKTLTAEAQKAIDEDGADVILLGSTTMHQAGDYMAEHLPVPVINPGPVAIKMAETLVQLGLSHSKVAFPPPSDDRGRPVLLAGGRLRGRCAQSQLLPTRSQATSLGSHSVLMRDHRRSAFFAPHFGHGGAGLVERSRETPRIAPRTSSHRYS